MIEDMMKYVLILVVSLMNFAAGQDSSGATPGVLCRFVCLGHHEDGTKELYARGTVPAEPNVKVNLALVSSGSRGTLMSAKNQIPFYKQPVVEGAPPPPISAMATIPPGAKEIIIFFFPVTGKEPVLYETVVFDMAAKDFPEGGCVVLNINDSDIRFAIGEHRLMVAPGKRAAIARPTQRDKYNMSSVAFQFQGDKGWRTVYDSTVRFPEGQRKVFITYVDAKTKRPRAHSFNFSS